MRPRHRTDQTGLAIASAILLVAALVGCASSSPTTESAPTLSDEDLTRSGPPVVERPADSIDRSEAAAAASAAIEAQRAADAAATAAAEAAEAAARQVQPPPAAAQLDLCPPGTQANSNDGVNDTSCFPVVCFTITVPDPAHPECDFAYPPEYYR